MRVQKVHTALGYDCTLLDDEGVSVPVVTKFLSFMRAKGSSHNTLLAYAHDLRHFFHFLGRADITYS